MEELTCQELVELVTDYFEGAMAPKERERFDAHVAECPGCDIYLEQMRATIALVGARAIDESSRQVSGLLDAFRDWRTRTSP